MVPERDTQNPDKIIYQAASPGEKIVIFVTVNTVKIMIGKIFNILQYI